MKLQISMTSMVCLIVTMGMGRFALTPQLPHMIAEKQINLTQASLLAAANFLGYLLGAIETINAKRHLILRLKCGLWGSVIILFLSALMPTNASGIYVNLLLRFVAGIASAWALVLISTWVQNKLGEEHALRALAFSGPCFGILLTGLMAIGLDYWHTSAALNWFVFGVVGLIVSLAIYKNLPGSLPELPVAEPFPMTGDARRLVISYAFCGMGYILPATFLSKLAVDQFPGSLAADAFWPLFGFAAVAGMALLALQQNIKNPQRWLAGIFCIQGLGILACTLLHGIIGLLIGALFVGGSFMVILQMTMHLGAELAPHHVRAMTGVLATGFAVGQLIGPLLSALSTHLWSSMAPALLFAAFGSFLAALLVYSIPSPLKVVVTLILLTTVLFSPNGYCQDEGDTPQLSTIVGKVVKMDLDSGVVNVEAGVVSKEIFLEAHLNTDLLWGELIKNGYIDANGEIQVPFYQLDKFSDMVLSKAFNAKKKLIYKIFQNAYMDNGQMMVFYIYIGSELLQGTHHIASIEIEQGDPVTIEYDTSSSDKNSVIRLVDGK